MNSPFTSSTSSPEKAKLQKQITDYTQFQWLALMPAWLPGVLGVINRTPITPGREGIVLAFRLGMIVFGIVCFALVRAKISSMKRALEKLEQAERNQQPPPIPAP